MTEQETNKPNLKLLLAAPRGFCAGVDRAITIVELAIKKYGPPVYVRHEIVHNKYVVENLKSQGAIFVEELDEVPDDAPVIFSAHGVPKSVPEMAESRGLDYLDATCPLVSKVHRQAERQSKIGNHIIFVGHAGHPEVIGTFGQVPTGHISLVETTNDAEKFETDTPNNLALLTQTTLSVDDTADVINILKRRFPNIETPKSEDICYATSNRQAAVKILAPKCDLMIVIGAQNSSNSVRLVESAEKLGISAILLTRADDLDFNWLHNVKTIGITAGASAPEILVRELIDRLATRYHINEEEIIIATEDIEFKLPKSLSDAQASA